MDRLMAFQERRVTGAARSLGEIIERHDLERWRALWPRLGALESPIRYLLGALPADFLGQGYALLEGLSSDCMPEAGSDQSREFLRFVVWSHAIHTVGIVESKWHVAFPDLAGARPALSLQGSQEYAALGELVFTQGAAPPGLECLDQSPRYTTNWISLDSVRRLSQLENSEHLLQRLGDELQTEQFPLGADLLALRRLLDFADLAGWSLYLWSPGS